MSSDRYDDYVYDAMNHIDGSEPHPDWCMCEACFSDLERERVDFSDIPFHAIAIGPCYCCDQVTADTHHEVFLCAAHLPIGDCLCAICERARA